MCEFGGKSYIPEQALVGDFAIVKGWKATASAAWCTATRRKLQPAGRCSLSLSGEGCIRRGLTDLAYLKIEAGAFVLRVRASGVSIEEIVAKTASALRVLESVPEMRFT